MQTATADPLVGRKLEGRYRILERIARGGMSTVYAAVDERLDRLVAVKVMSPELSNDPAFSDRFAREARAAARLTHLNAVSVYDQGHEVGPNGHLVFLVMELVEGRTLRELLRERGRLTPAEAVSIMEPVLSALSAAHRAGLVHRDIKPENILLSDEGVVKVADFGLARAVETDVASTRTGLMMGTVAYCAPEQISRGHADPRADVYSAGVVLFELLTGEAPYRGDSAMNVAYQHVNSRVPAPSSRVRAIPTEIDEVVVATTDRDPAGRPADASAFLAELADVRSALALPVTPVPPRARAARKVGRRETGADGAPTAYLPDRGPRPNDTAVERPPSGQPRMGDFPVPGLSPQHPSGPPRNGAPPPPVVIPPGRAARRRPWRRAIIVTVVVLALGIGSFFGARAFIQWRFAHVPNVAGQSRSEAEAALKHADYKVVLGAAQNSESVAAGKVIRTSPKAGSRLTTGKTVRLTLSLGRKTFTIPNVSNQSESDARDTLQAAGITVAPGRTTRASDTVAAGRVIATTPAIGATVYQGQSVSFTVSSGLPYLAIPNVASGTSLGDAQQQLRAAGFPKQQTTEEFNNTIGKGDVISISPTGKARKTQTITITVSKGPQQVPVPNISIGMPIDQAEQQLTAVGLVPQVIPVNGATALTVLTVAPAAGTVVDVGSTVKIYALAA